MDSFNSFGVPSTNHNLRPPNKKNTKLSIYELNFKEESRLSEENLNQRSISQISSTYHILQLTKYMREGLLKHSATEQRMRPSLSETYSRNEAFQQKQFSESENILEINKNQSRRGLPLISKLSIQLEIEKQPANPLDKISNMVKLRKGEKVKLNIKKPFENKAFSQSKKISEFLNKETSYGKVEEEEKVENRGNGYSSQPKQELSEAEEKKEAGSCYRSVSSKIFSIRNLEMNLGFDNCPEKPRNNLSFMINKSKEIDSHKVKIHILNHKTRNIPHELITNKVKYDEILKTRKANFKEKIKLIKGNHKKLRSRSTIGTADPKINHAHNEEDHEFVSAWINQDQSDDTCLFL